MEFTEKRPIPGTFTDAFDFEQTSSPGRAAEMRGYSNLEPDGYLRHAM